MPKPMIMILVGAFITIVGGVVTAIGTFRQNKSSSLKSDSILSNTGLTIEGVKLLQSENGDLKSQVADLSEKTE